MNQYLTIRQARENLRLTLEQVSEKTGISVRKLQSWEGNRGRMYADELMILCRFYRISPDHVCYGSNPEGRTA